MSTYFRRLFMATEPIRTPACPTHRRCISTVTTCSSRSIGSQELWQSMSADPAPLPVPQPAPPPSDDIELYNLNDHSLDCQTCRNLPERSGRAVRCLELPDTEPSSHTDGSAPANEEVGTDDRRTSDPAFSRSPTSSLPSTKTTKYLRFITSLQSKVCSQWSGSLLGLSSLTLAIVALLMFTLRSYKMAVWTTRNDELQACIGLFQVCDIYSSSYCLLMQE